MDWFDFSLKLPITDPTWIFLLVLLIILFAPILLNKLRIPHIIGMILAGLVIGEHGFNILVRDSSFELFGKVGLYYIMFLAGLEMNMGDFKQNRGKALVLGLLAFIIPIGIGLVTNVALLKYGVVTSVLLASMYASHTLVAYPIVIRYGVSRHRSVSIAVGGTMVAGSAARTNFSSMTLMPRSFAIVAETSRAFRKRLASPSASPMRIFSASSFTLRPVYSLSRARSSSSFKSSSLRDSST